MSEIKYFFTIKTRHAISCAVNFYNATFSLAHLENLKKCYFTLETLLPTSTLALYVAVN
jgi:hypothetical protein